MPPNNIVKLPVAQVGEIRSSRWRNIRRWWNLRKDRKYDLKIAKLKHEIDMAQIAYDGREPGSSSMRRTYRLLEESKSYLRYVERINEIKRKSR